MQLLNGTNNSILDKAFQSAKLNETRWYQSIHTLLRVNGFAYVLDDSLTFDREVFPRIFKQRCTDIYYQNTRNRLENSPKFNFYYNMVIKQNNKDIYKYQPYLDKAKNIEHRKSMKRLRCMTLILEEENGRHPRSIRISEHANSALVKKLKIGNISKYIVTLIQPKDEDYSIYWRKLMQLGMIYYVMMQSASSF